jgi:hypothetical protein
MKDVIESLIAAPEYMNPAIALARELMEAETRGDKETIKDLSRSLRIEHALIDGEAEGFRVIAALSSCGHSPPVASKTVPVGF